MINLYSEYNVNRNEESWYTGIVILQVLISIVKKDDSSSTQSTHKQALIYVWRHLQASILSACTFWVCLSPGLAIHRASWSRFKQSRRDPQRNGISSRLSYHIYYYKYGFIISRCCNCQSISKKHLTMKWKSVHKVTRVITLKLLVQVLQGESWKSIIVAEQNTISLVAFWVQRAGCRD